MHPRRSLLLLSLVAALTAAAYGQTVSQAAMQEENTATAFDHIRQSPLLLESFLRNMPKGGDLHMHLDGAVYAETFIKDAISDGLCVNTATLTFIKPATPNTCAAGQVTASTADTDQTLYDKLVDAFSMRSFVPSSGISGHDQFFATFDRFEAFNGKHNGEWLAEVANRAAAQNETYLEIMNTPDFSHAAAIAAQIGWPADPSVTPDFAAMRDKLLALGLRNDVATVQKDATSFEASRDALEDCGTPQAQPGCTVRMRYLFQVLRALPPAVVYAQTLLAFETVSAELATGHARYVGLNFVQPEDAFVPMRDYHLHMEMIAYLHTVYPNVRISLHAGELAPGMVPPDGLRFHIREAIEIAHAERIGHGVDVMYEDNPDDLLAEMARKHVLVEINLTSNDVILGITGTHHPLPFYLAAGVPVALSTDDEGVSRIDLTHEYLRAVTDFGLNYRELKQMSRASLEHSFLPGDDLWSAPDTFARAVSACSGQHLGNLKPTAACSAFLAASPRAAAQWDLETRYHAFESRIKWSAP